MEAVWLHCHLKANVDCRSLLGKVSTIFKGKVHPKMRIQSLSIRPHADGKLGEVSLSTKRFRSFAAKQCCSVLLNNWSKGLSVVVRQVFNQYLGWPARRWRRNCCWSGKQKHLVGNDIINSMPTVNMIMLMKEEELVTSPRSWRRATFFACSPSSNNSFFI